MTNPKAKKPQKQRARTKKPGRIKKWWRQNGHNLPVTIVSMAATLALASFSVRGIFESNPDTLSAIFESASSVSCEILALIGISIAALKAMDKRPEVRAGAKAAFVFALMLTAVPINYLGGSNSMKKAQAERVQYIGSDEQKTDLQMIANPEKYNDEDVYKAKQNIKKAQPPVSPMKFECYGWAAFLYLAIMFGTAAFMRPAKETPAEARARMYAERAEKARKTREIERRTAEEKAEAERKRAQSLMQNIKVKVIDLFTGNARAA